MISEIKFKDKVDVLDPIIIESILKIDGKTIFDYGCGDGQLTQKFAEKGYTMTAFDISDKLIQENKLKHIDKSVRYLSENEFENQFKQLEHKFDIVLCSLVICTIESDEMVQNVLRNIYELMRVNGRGIIAVCNPNYTQVKESEIQYRFLPENCDLGSKFEYKKKIKTTNRIRTDIHRHLKLYQNLLSNSGFTIMRKYETPGKDLENDNYSSDFLIFDVVKNIEDEI